MQNALSSDFKATPFWWEEAPLRPANAPLPRSADVAIVGAGYCGLMAALTLARAGRSVVVLDAKDPGFGASTRNHGHISANGGKIPYDLVKRVGEQQAGKIWRDSAASARFFKEFLSDEKLEVDFIERGRFQGAHSAVAFRQMAKTVEHCGPKWA
jgi:glycine/D-amino acid oxidase-like deaminating enzyme